MSSMQCLVGAVLLAASGLFAPSILRASPPQGGGGIDPILCVSPCLKSPYTNAVLGWTFTTLSSGDGQGVLDCSQTCWPCELTLHYDYNGTSAWTIWGVDGQPQTGSGGVHGRFTLHSDCDDQTPGQWLAESDSNHVGPEAAAILYCYCQ